MDDSHQAAAKALRGYALRYPETFEEQPWGDKVVKVRGKIFLFAGVHKDRFHVTTKLPQSNAAALLHPWATPTGYGLGKSGWVSAGFDPGDEVPLALLKQFVDESFRAVAPKSLQKLVPESGPPAERPPTDVRKLDGLRPPGPILFVGADDLRQQRAVDTLALAGIGGGIAGLDVGAFVAAQESAPCAIVIDLVRESAQALALASELLTESPCLVLAGIKDKKSEAKTIEAFPHARAYSRKSPGEVAFLGELLGLVTAS